MMEYYVQTRDSWVKIDYPCYGVLCELHGLSSQSWKGDVMRWDPTISDWNFFNHIGYSEGSYHPLEGFEPDDISAIFTINDEGLESIPEHGMFKHISLTTAGEADIPNVHGDVSFFRLDMAEVPCDELFIPMFMLRNVFGDSGDSDPFLYLKYRGEGYDRLQSTILANLWYKSTRGVVTSAGWASESIYYAQSEDGATFSDCKVGDVVHIMNGGMPNFMSSNWGSLKSGYPSYGYSDDATEEPYNSLTKCRHHMSHCTVMQKDYPDTFLNTCISNNGSYFTEEELTDFIKEIMKHVK